MKSGCGNIDPECGVAAASQKQLVPLARNLLRFVNEIELKVLSGSKEVFVACQNGTNRSFLVANLYYQKAHDIDYETTRQLMTNTREDLSAPLYTCATGNEGYEFARKNCKDRRARDREN